MPTLGVAAGGDMRKAITVLQSASRLFGAPSSPPRATHQPLFPRNCGPVRPVQALRCLLAQNQVDCGVCARERCWRKRQDPLLSAEARSVCCCDEKLDEPDEV